MNIDDCRKGVKVRYIPNLVNTVNRMVKLGYFPMGGMSVEPWRNGDEQAKYYQAMYKPAQDFREI